MRWQLFAEKIRLLICTTLGKAKNIFMSLSSALYLYSAHCFSRAFWFLFYWHNSGLSLRISLSLFFYYTTFFLSCNFFANGETTLKSGAEKTIFIFSRLSRLSQLGGLVWGCPGYDPLRLASLCFSKSMNYMGLCLVIKYVKRISLVDRLRQSNLSTPFSCKMDL